MPMTPRGFWRWWRRSRQRNESLGLLRVVHNSTRYFGLLSSIGAVRMNACFSASPAVAALAAFAVATPVAAQQAKQDFVLVNRTGYELLHVYVSPNRSNDWEDDVLGQIRYNKNTDTTSASFD